MLLSLLHIFLYLYCVVKLCRPSGIEKTMSEGNIVNWVLLFLFLCSVNFSTSLKNKDKPCTKIGTCKCIFPTGRGINLLAIGNIFSVPLQSNDSLHIHLCDNVSFGKNDSSNQCFHNVSVCYVSESENTSLSLGKAEDTTFVAESEFQPKSLQFIHNEKKTIIALVCSEESTEPRLTLTSKEDNVFNLQLESKHACLHAFSLDEVGTGGGLSTGSALVIMFMVFTLVYFGGGMLTLRFLRGAEGREMIPNIDFWTDLPYLVRDGVLFSFNGFQPASAYDRI